MADNDKTASVLTAFVIGGIVGATLGILFAPKSGKETRAELGDWCEDTLEKGKEKMQKLGDEVKRKKDQLTQAIHNHTA
jgi:gas vesicle protein